MAVVALHYPGLPGCPGSRNQGSRASASCGELRIARLRRLCKVHSPQSGLYDVVFTGDCRIHVGSGLILSLLCSGRSSRTSTSAEQRCGRHSHGPGRTASLLAEHGVEGDIRKGQGNCISFLPMNRRAGGRRMGAGNGKHCGIHVDCGHLTARADQRRRHARHNSRSACHIKHAFAGLGRCMPQQDVSPVDA